MTAVSKDVVAANLCGNGWAARHANRDFLARAKVSFGLPTDSKHSFCSGSIRSCSNPCDSERFRRPHDIASDQQLVCNLGKHQRPVSERLRVAVDLDEVLGNFLVALNRFIADRYSMNCSIEDYHTYEFREAWNCSRMEANIRLHEFFETPYFKMGVNPIPGAQDALCRLSAVCSFSIVTARQNKTKNHTIEWIQKHFPNLFEEIHFANRNALDGQSKSKSEICRSLGAQVLIDDNPKYAIGCAEAGIRVILFDHNNSYPWSKTGFPELHPLVTKAHSWKEVEQQLTSWFAS